MHSKWKIWDYFASNKEVISGEYLGKIVAIQTFDPFAFQIIKQKMNTNYFSEGHLHVKSALDVSINWLEDNYMSLGLFGNSESYLILNAQLLNKECKDFLTQENLILDNRVLILDYSKEDDLLKKLKKKENAATINIQAPAFWENDKLLDFIGNHLAVYLDARAKDFLLDTLPSEFMDYYNTLYQIKLNYPDEVNLSLEKIKEFVVKKKVDQFELAKLLGSKKLKNYYQNIIQIEDFNELRSIFMFIQSHLLKIYDPSYTQGKSRLTKYDKEILAQASVWSKQDLEKAILHFSQMEVLAKSKDQLLFNKLKGEMLSFMH